MTTSAVNLIQRLHQHRGWVNNNLLAAAAKLNDEQLHKTFAIGQGSVWKTLTHMFGAEYVWLATLEGTENAVAPGDLPGHIPGNQLAENKIASLAELQAKWNELQARWDKYLSMLSPESLDGVVTRTSSQGVKMATRRSDVLLHVCTHNQYTTAQMMNMLRQLGVEKLPDVMLMAMARQEAKAQQ